MQKGANNMVLLDGESQDLENDIGRLRETIDKLKKIQEQKKKT